MAEYPFGWHNDRKNALRMAKAVIRSGVDTEHRCLSDPAMQERVKFGILAGSLIAVWRAPSS